MDFSHYSFVSVLVVIVGLLSSSVTQASSVPSQYLIKSLTQKRPSSRQIRIKSSVTAYQGDQPLGAHFRETSWVELGSKTLRAQIFDDQNKVLYVFERKFGTDGFFVDSLLFETDLPTLTAELKKLGFPVLTEEELAKLPDENERRGAEKVSLTRMGKTPAWKIEASGFGSIWFDHGSLALARFTHPSLGSGEWISVEGLRPFKDYSFPRSMALVETTSGGDKIILKDELHEASTGFSGQEWKAALLGGSTGFTEDGNRTDSATRSLILTYFQKVR